MAYWTYRTGLEWTYGWSCVKGRRAVLTEMEGFLIWMG